MRHLYLSLVVLVLLATNSSCKKENSQGPADTSLLQIGPMSNYLGKLVYIGKYGIGRNFTWGRNSNELFLNADTNLLRIDFTSGKIESLGDIGIQGKTNENSAVILTDSYKPHGGYYLYKFNSNKIEFLFNTPQNETAILNIANNHYFYWARANSTVDPNYSCSGFCWPLPISGKVNFYHLNTLTNVVTTIKNRNFIRFSKDGNKTMLGNPGFPPFYIYDNEAAKIVDSLGDSWSNTFYFDGIIKYASAFAGEILIRDLRTNDVLLKVQSKIYSLSELKFSSDGTRLYYTGGQLSGSGTLVAILDLITGQESIVAEVPDSAPGGIGSVYLSDDNKKMVFESANNFYVKDM